MSEHNQEFTEKNAPPVSDDVTRIAPASAGRGVLITGVIVAVLILGGLITVLSRSARAKALTKETEQNALPTVSVITPKPEKPEEELLLPGSLQAYTESPIYARTSGYLVRWYKDIGSPVKKGELLAQIDTPEVDQELLQTKAAREQIVAQLGLAKISADRWQNLRKSDSVSQQEADQQISGYQQAQANLAAADANVKRLEQLESFKNVYSPFSGVLTKRNVDPGALINAGANGKEMFDIAQVDPLRVFVSVPQAYANNIHVGMPANVTLQEFPNQKFQGKVTHTADAIDPTTRTLLTEVDVPNPKGTLLPGSFGQVHFAVKSGVERVTIPVNAMLFRSEGPQVAVVENNKVQLRPISIGRDYGASLEVLGGITANDRIVINPADSIEDGQQVNVAPANAGDNNGKGGSAEGAQGEKKG
jgi:RND family efflux transporter MFP subunit